MVRKPALYPPHSEAPGQIVCTSCVWQDGESSSVIRDADFRKVPVPEIPPGLSSDKEPASQLSPRIAKRTYPLPYHSRWTWTILSSSLVLTVQAQSWMVKFSFTFSLSLTLFLINLCATHFKQKSPKVLNGHSFLASRW